jgi:hypothetical protein
MSFAKKPERAVRRPVLEGSSVPSSLLLRTVLVGLLAIGGATWALVRHYTHTPPPMLVPVPSVPAEAPTYDPDAGEFPVPDFGNPSGPDDGPR